MQIQAIRNPQPLFPTTPLNLKERITSLVKAIFCFITLQFSLARRYFLECLYGKRFSTIPPKKAPSKKIAEFIAQASPIRGSVKRGPPPKRQPVTPDRPRKRNDPNPFLAAFDKDPKAQTEVFIQADGYVDVNLNELFKKMCEAAAKGQLTQENIVKAADIYTAINEDYVFVKLVMTDSNSGVTKNDANLLSLISMMSPLWYKLENNTISVSDVQANAAFQLCQIIKGKSTDEGTVRFISEIEALYALMPPKEEVTTRLKQIRAIFDAAEKYKTVGHYQAADHLVHFFSDNVLEKKLTCINELFALYDHLPEEMQNKLQDALFAAIPGCSLSPDKKTLTFTSSLDDCTAQHLLKLKQVLKTVTTINVHDHAFPKEFLTQLIDSCPSLEKIVAELAFFTNDDADAASCLYGRPNLIVEIPCSPCLARTIKGLSSSKGEAIKGVAKRGMTGAIPLAGMVPDRLLPKMARVKKCTFQPDRFSGKIRLTSYSSSKSSDLLVILSFFKKIESLTLTKATDDFLKNMAERKLSIQELFISKSKDSLIKAGCIQHLAKLENLKTLKLESFYDIPFSFQGHTFKDLETLDLTKCEKVKLDSLTKDSFPKLTQLTIPCTPEEEAKLKKSLSGCTITRLKTF